MYISPPSPACLPPHRCFTPPGHHGAQAGLPVLHSFPRAIYFTHGSVYMSVLLSQFCPLPFFSLLPHFLCLLPSINPQRILRLKEETQWEEVAFHYRSPWNQCLRAPDWIQTLLHLGKATEPSLGKTVYTHIHTHAQQHEMTCGNVEMWKWNKACPSAQTLSLDCTRQALGCWLKGTMSGYRAFNMTPLWGVPNYHDQIQRSLMSC